MQPAETSKHTPGPWAITEKTWSRHGCALEGTTPVVRMAGPCDAVIVSLGADKAEQEANARLIAAAPETAAERDKLKEIMRSCWQRWKRCADTWENGAVLVNNSSY